MNEQKVAVVTGASRGVGRGIATALGAAGWTVYVTARGPAGPGTSLAKTIARIEAGGGKGVAITCDHTVDSQTAALFAQIAASEGRLDLLVNNAWAGPPDGFAGFAQPFWERPASDWDSLIGIGLRAHYVASVEAAKIMVPQGSGVIANISSFGSRGYLHSVLYGMSKAGLDKMAADMAVDLRSTGVTAVSLWLGLIQTDMLLKYGIEEFEGFRIAESEQPEFVGQVIETLTRDPNLASYNGDTIITAEYGAANGIRNSDGVQPISHRDAFGGGPIFPPAGAGAASAR